MSYEVSRQPMPLADPDPPGNLLLRALLPEDRAALAPHLAPVPFSVGDVIAYAGERIESLCFLEQGIAGALDSLGDERQYAVGLLGAEGYVGWSLPMGDDRMPYDVVMRAERGDALRIPAEAMLAAADASGSLRTALLRFAHVFMLQMGRTIVSSLAHTIERRMARWLLLYHDRVQTDGICVTHEEFGLMLGVRRSSITDALHRLEEERGIRSLRGRIVVSDRAWVLALAGDTYGRPEQEHARLFGRSRAPGVRPA